MSTNVPSQDYHLIEEVIADGDISVKLYQNKITGLRVVTAFVESPIVKSDLVFATEAFDDDGLPHTLEHLVFLGSDDYPYKGILDMIANKCLAHGTNAYTDTDHTNYTTSTVGIDGFLHILPVYLDHVLFPTLTDFGYTTEVHHINGNGEDAGVVYCEMQAIENNGDTRCYLEMLRSLYPGKCGYKSETGGIMKNLRESTNNEKVRKYHKDFYHSKNLCVVATGPVDAQAIFDKIKPVEDKIVRRGMHNLKFDRPWQTPVEPIQESVNRKIQYSCDTNDDGLVYIGFRGPNVATNYKELIGLTIILEYLNSTAASPFQRDFVECDEPFCSSVSHSIIENSCSCFYITFESVGKQYLDAVLGRLFKLLKKIETGEEELDMDRLSTVISRKKVQILSCAEQSPHSIVIGPIIGHFLYGTGKLKDRIQEIPILEEHGKHNADFWRRLVAKYFTGPDARHVCIVGEPSPELMKSMSAQEEERVAKQKEDLADKLPMFAEKLRQAIEKNDIPAPEKVLSDIPKLSIDNIMFHPIERVVLDPKLNVPFRMQYDSIKTNFVTTTVLLNTSECLSKKDRLYLPLLSEIILESSIERDNELVPYEKVVSELYSDTVINHAGIGLSFETYSASSVSSLFGIRMQVEVKKYEKSVKWFHEILYKTRLTSDRIKTVATRLVSDISQLKRSGSKVTSATMGAVTYQSNSNQWATNFVRQQKFIKKLLKDIKAEPESVQQDITKVRDLLTKSNKFLVHITLNKNNIDVSNLHKPWLEMIPKDQVTYGHLSFDQIVHCNTLVEFLPNPKAFIVGVGSVESSYMHQLVKSIDSIKHPDLAAVNVLLAYLTQLEGPLWRAIRGLGLSYSYSINLSASDGLIHFGLSRASNLVAAYEKTVEVVGKFLNGDEEFEDNLFDSAKSSLIYELINREKSAAGRSALSLFAYLRDLDVDYNKELVKKVLQVTKDDLRRVGPKYLQPLFQSAERRTVICCHPAKLEEISQGLRDANCQCETVNLEKESFLNSIE